MATIARDTRAVLTKLKRTLDELYGEKLSSVVLFGSHATGDATEDSDIDVLIVLEGPFDAREERKRTLDTIAAISLEYNVLISDIITDEHAYREGTAPLFATVKQEGIRL